MANEPNRKQTSRSKLETHLTEPQESPKCLKVKRHSGNHLTTLGKLSWFWHGQKAQAAKSPKSIVTTEAKHTERSWYLQCGIWILLFARKNWKYSCYYLFSPVCDKSYFKCNWRWKVNTRHLCLGWCFIWEPIITRKSVWELGKLTFSNPLSNRKFSAANQ